MENFSWVFSVIIPIISSLIPSLLAFTVGVRKERNAYINGQIKNIEEKLDKIYQTASQIYITDYSDEYYHHMVYEVGDIKTMLSRVNSDLAIFQYSIFYRILTDHIFHNKKQDTMQQLSEHIQIIKSNLKRKYF